MESYHKIKEKLLENQNDKTINLKPYNDDNGVVDNQQHKYINQLQYITDDEGCTILHIFKMMKMFHNIIQMLHILQIMKILHEDLTDITDDEDD